MPALDLVDPERYVREVVEARGNLFSFSLDSDRWRTYRKRVRLRWRSVRFTRGNRGLVPEARGVYTFIVHASHDCLPPHGYPVYVGITGDGRSKETLTTRYAGYLREQKERDRYHIFFMLNKWKNNIFFCYATVRDKRYSLGKLETALNDALLPPFSRKDFSAEVRELIRAFPR